jgi:hypothetical protein
MAIYKGLVILEEQKYPKIKVVITNFSKIETRKKALYVRLKGIPEGGLKPFKTKGFRIAIILIKISICSHYPFY